MTLNPRFSRYLEHFGATVPVREFAAAPEKPHLTSLRHDVDYNLDVAMELAYWEYKAGLRSTYFVLHSTAYYQHDKALIDKCLQLQDFGHEVGLHTNFLAEWYRGNIDDVGLALEKELIRLRTGGVDITGVTAHGDALCYDAGFTNYWIFEELRPDVPATSERRVTAEGTVGRDVDRVISYPEDSHKLVRSDGSGFDYWSLKLPDFGLDYEASRLATDSYFSDSGGTWKRTPDPLTHTFGKDRSLVLMHPIYWKGEQRHYYFLSTARSGSNWLASFLDKATPVTARHEFTLNHKFKNGVPNPHKRTASGFIDLVTNSDEANRLIGQARSWSEGLDTDYAEANIYLERFLDLLPRGPDTEIVHLHRDPRDVVRSLLQRGWYSVPHDDRHPKIDVDGWDSMSQLEQICWYVRDVNEKLSKACSFELRFEDMVRDFPALSAWLVKRGIPVFPRFAKMVFGERVNATPDWKVDKFESWPEADRTTFNGICGPIREALGYGQVDAPGTLMAQSGEQPDLPAQSKFEPETALLTLFDLCLLSKPGSVSLHRCVPVSGQENQITFFPKTRGYLLLGGGFWSPDKESPKALRQKSGDVFVSPLTCWSGWQLEEGNIYLIDLAAEFPHEGVSLRVICLSYDDQGSLIARQDIGSLSHEWPSFARFFRPRRGAASFNIALFKGPDDAGATIEFKKCKLVKCVENRAQLGTPEQVSALARRRVQFPISHPSSDPLIVSIGVRRCEVNLRIPLFKFVGNTKSIRSNKEYSEFLFSKHICENIFSILNKLMPFTGGESRLECNIESHSKYMIYGCATIETHPGSVSYSLVGVPQADGGGPAYEDSFRLGTFLPDQNTVHFRIPEIDGMESFEIQIVRTLSSDEVIKISANIQSMGPVAVEDLTLRNAQEIS